MGINEGSISAQLELQLSQFAQQAQQAATITRDLGAQLSALPPVTLTLDTTALAQQVQQASATTRQALAALQAETQQALPPVTPHVDLAPLERDKALYEAALQQMAEDAARVPPARPHVDTGPLQRETAEGRQSLQSMGEALKAIENTPGRPTLDLAALRTAVQGALAELSTFRGGLEQVAKQGLGLDVSGLEKDVGKATSLLGQLGPAVAGAVNPLALAGAAFTAFGAATVTAALKIGEGFEAAERKLAVQTGLMGEQLEALNQHIVKLGATGIDPGKIEAVLVPLTQRLQLTGEALDNATRATLQYAKVTGQDASEAATHLTQLMTQFRIPADQYRQSLNDILVASQQTATNARDIQEGLARYGPILQQVGLSFREATAFVAQMSTAAEGGRGVMAALSAALQQAAQAGQDPRQVFAAITAALKEQGDTTDVLQQRLQALLGARGYAELRTLAQAGKLDFDALTAAMDKNGNALSQAAAQSRSGADELGKALTGLTVTLLGPLGTALDKAIAQFERGLAGAINATARAVKGLADQLSDPTLNRVLTLLAGGAATAATAPIPGLGGLVASGVGAAQAGGLAGTGAGDEAAGHTAAAEATEKQSKAVLDLTTAFRDGKISLAEYREGLVQLLGPTDDAKKALDELDKAIKAAHGDAAQIQSLLQLRDAHQEIAKATNEGTLAQRAYFTAQQQLLEQGDRQAQDAQAAANAAAAQVTALRALADAEQDAAKQAALGRAIADAEADALVKGATARALNTQAYEAYQQKAGEARAATAANAETQARLNALVSAAAPGLDTATQAELKQAIALQNTSGVLDVLQQKLGLTAEQRARLEAAFSGTGADFQRQTDALKGAIEPISTLDDRYRALAETTLPRLTAAQADHIQRLLKEHDSAGAATEAVAGLAGGEAALAAAVSGSGGEFERQKSQLAAVVEGMTRAGHVAEEEYGERLKELGTAVLPRLSEAQAVALKQAQLLGDQQAQLAIVSAATGRSQDDLQAALHGTGDALKEVAAQAAAAAKGFEGFLTDETKSRWQSALGTLTSGLSAADAARAKFLEGVGQTEAALAEMLQKVGLAPASVDAFKSALLAGGAAAQDAQEKLKALTTFARDEFGNLRLKVDIDIEKAVEKIHELQQTFREAQADRARAEADAQAAFDAAAAKQDETEQRNVADHARHVAEIAQAQGDAQNKLNESVRKAQETADKAQRDVGDHLADAWSKFVTSVADAEHKLDETLTDALVQYRERRQDLVEKGNEALQTAAKGQAAALSSLSQAMTAFNQQQVQNLFQQSVALQSRLQQQLAATPGYDPNDFRNQQNAANVAFVQAQGQAALQQASQQTLLGQAQKSAADKAREATEQLDKTIKENNKQLEKLNEQYGKQARNAFEQHDRSLEQAETGLDKAETDAARKRDDSAHQLSEALNTAQRELDRQVRDIQQRADTEAEQFGRQLADLQRQRDDLQRQFEKGEADRARAERRADEQFQRQLQQALATLAALEALKGLPGQIGAAVAAAVNGQHPEVNIGAVTMDEFGTVLMREGLGYMQQQVASLTVNRFSNLRLR